MKQVELGDKMDLSSYLLKPVQRMSKYALLLTDLMKEVGVAQEAELAALQAATDMVKFQLRHGNDLLAMDAIRDCDVNLKEQGQLIRQDEFTVWTGRRKCQRHVFLFEELVLFSKPKKVDGGLDVFIYKQSFKTADVGLTESAGDSGLRFEIWFRRRTSKNQTFILQPASVNTKQAWTADIARILWTQATRNKALPSSSPAESSYITSCIEEDEQEHETSSQPSMTTESSGSSSRCLSGSTGSDSGCVSSNLQEALPEETSPHSIHCSSSNNKQHLKYNSPKAAPIISPATIV
ncbi:Pleckstrin homology domain-containing family G member 4B [Larimichthys crocea]|nr:Pleckstrin homology domain-containing family G member 4B [Larimichthys crocea]